MRSSHSRSTQHRSQAKFILPLLACGLCFTWLLVRAVDPQDRDDFVVRGHGFEDSQDRGDDFGVRGHGPGGAPHVDSNSDALRLARRSMRCLDLVEAQVVAKVKSMAGFARRRATFFLAVQSFTNGPDVESAHFLEAGVAGGATAIILASVLTCLGTAEDATLYLADSWEGLQPNKEEFPDDKNFKEGEYHVTYEDFKKRWQKWSKFWEEHRDYQVFPWNDVNVVEMRGLFKDTMSVENAFDELRFLRCDGDMYESTYQCLQYGYPKLLPGGYVYIDDYGAFRACFNSVHDFRRDFGVSDKLSPIYRIEEIDSGDKHWLYQHGLDEHHFLFGPNQKDKLGTFESGKVEGGFWRKPLDPSGDQPYKFPFEWYNGRALGGFWRKPLDPNGDQPYKFPFEWYNGHALGGFWRKPLDPNGHQPYKFRFEWYNGHALGGFWRKPLLDPNGDQPYKFPFEWSNGHAL